jgi:hypothetical protein
MGVAASTPVKAPSEQQWRGRVREYEQIKVTRMDHTVRKPFPSTYPNVNVPCGPSSTVRTMICLHPYNTWPLHVKLFTKDAVKHWEDAANRPPSLSLPPGFTCRVELEGVNGKSGLIGSGRKGPIDVTDGTNRSMFPVFGIPE